MNKTKRDWINYFVENKFISTKHKIQINNKNVYVSSFYMYASEKHKKDRYLNALNFEATQNPVEIPPEIIDISFLKEVFNLKYSSSIFKIPYQWKNNNEEKEFLKEVLETFQNRYRDYRADEINWSFEEGFWSDLSFTKEIKQYNYYTIDLNIIKDLNKSKNEEDISFLLKIVEKDYYFFRKLKNKYKNLIEDNIVIKYLLDYGIKDLTKEQKDKYEVIKAAFHNGVLTYYDIDEKWKNKEILLDLLNTPNIWRVCVNNNEKSKSSNNHYSIHLDMLPKSFLSDKELMKICMSDGFNLLELKKMGNPLYKDKDLKKAALKTYADYRIIEDCLYDKEMVLEFVNNLTLNKKMGYSGISLFSQTKIIPEEIFKDVEVMKSYLAIPDLNNSAFFSENVISAFTSYNVETLVELININPEVYKKLPQDLRSNWEIVYACYEKYQRPISEMPTDINFIIFEAGKTYEEVSPKIRSYALNEQLKRELEDKKIVKKLKI